MSNQKLIIIRGYPGSGKTTVGKALARESIGIFIDHNKILTFLAVIVSNDLGIYDEIQALEQAIAKKLLADNKNVIVARGFSKRETVEIYINIAKETQSEIYILRLEVSDSNLRSRVVAEERNKDYNPTITEADLSAWMHENPMEIIESEHEIDANKPMSQILSHVLRILGP